MYKGPPSKGPKDEKDTSTHSNHDSDHRSQHNSPRSPPPSSLPGSPLATPSDLTAIRSSLRSITKPLPQIPSTSANSSHPAINEEPLPFQKPRSNDLFMERPSVLDIEIGGGRKRFHTTAQGQSDNICSPSSSPIHSAHDERNKSPDSPSEKENKRRSNSGGNIIGGSIQMNGFQFAHVKDTSSSSPPSASNGGKKVSPIKDLLNNATISSIQHHYPISPNPPSSPPLPPKRPQRIINEEKVKTIDR